MGLLVTKLKKKLRKVINKEQVVLLPFDKVIFSSSERHQTLGLECQRIHCACILCVPGAMQYFPARGTAYITRRGRVSPATLRKGEGQHREHLGMGY